MHNYAHGLRGFSVDRALLLSAVTGLSLDELFEPFKRRRQAPPDTS
ncbi:MAG: hypothetical protein SF051_11870 [Elusimicrobiota bacterium]|nr:hypothetical protein [Elusimicrobiota bacterium]